MTRRFNKQMHSAANLIEIMKTKSGEDYVTAKL